MTLPMSKILPLNQAVKRLLEQVERGDKSPVFVELPRAVGVDILDTVSGDLYKDAFHVVRELIQNSYDENAENVELLVSGGTVLVKDDGRGMDFRALVGTRRLSESEKVYNPERYPNPVRGFRKLGIYSGYQIARRLELRTKQAGNEFEMTLYLNFEKMHTEVVANRQRQEEQRWDFTKLIENCTYVEGRKVNPEEVPLQGSYTIAQLVDVEATASAAWAKLSDSKVLANYVVQTFSLAFDKAFLHRATIHAHLTKYVPGFHPFTIKLCTAEGEHVLKRPAIADVDDIKLVRVPKNAKNPLAVGWIGRRKDRALDDESARGIVFKVGGITIGDRSAGREGASADHYYFYDRLTGEFHVIDSEIKPDPERASFNPSAKAEQLSNACDEIVNDIVAYAREDRKAISAQTSSQKKVTKLIKRWEALKPCLDEPPKTKDALIERAVDVAVCLREMKTAQLSVPEKMSVEAGKNIQEMETMLVRAFGAGALARTATKAPDKRRVSLLDCLRREELTSSDTLLSFLKTVNRVLEEELNASYKDIVQAVSERWKAH